jgi:hypothetical protein
MANKNDTGAASNYSPDFGGALAALQAGKFVARKGWNGKNMHLGLQQPDAKSVNTLPYIYMITVDRKRVPWVASHTDILSSDWYLVDVQASK